MKGRDNNSGVGIMVMEKMEDKGTCHERSDIDYGSESRGSMSGSKVGEKEDQVL